MKKTHLALISLILLTPLAGFSITGSEIIRRSEKAVRGDTLIASYEITIQTRRWERTMKMNSWEDRKGNRSFSEITASKKDAGNRFLLIDKTMRHYVPSLQQEIIISPSMMLQSWMGSDFTNDDIVKESSILEDYNHILKGEKTEAGHECYVIELQPKPDAPVVWGKIIYYARKKDYLPVRQEFYGERDQLRRVMTFSEFKKVHDRVIPTFYKMETEGKKDRYTTIKILNARFNLKIPESVFTIQNLRKR